MRIFRLTYFLLPATATDSALSTLKQCLHYDPDSKPCFAARRLVKTLSKSMSKLSQSESHMNWYGVINLVAGQKSEGGLIREFEDALKEHFSQEKLPGSLQPVKSSPRLAEMYRSACRAYTKLGKAREGEAYCDALLGMKGMDDDAVGLVGRGEALLVKEEWEAALRVLERAFEATGKSDREVRPTRPFGRRASLTSLFCRSWRHYRKHRNCLSSQNRRTITRSLVSQEMRIRRQLRRLSESFIDR